MILNFGMRKGGKRDVEPRGGFPWGWPIALLILIVFIVVVKLISGDPGALSPDGGDGGGGTGEIIPGSGGGGLDSYIILIVTLAIIGIIAYTIAKEIWSRRFSPQTGAQGDEVREMIDQAVDSLEAGDDPRLVVYDCYLRMCILLERKGMTDISYMTPGEFASAAVREFQLPRDRVEELTRLFEEARYSDHPVREGMRNRSIRCLNHIRKSLERGRVEPGPEC